MTKKVN